MGERVQDERGGASGTRRPAVALVGGTGKLGSALALRLARAGYEVTIGSRDAARAAQIAESRNDRLLPDDGSAIRGSRIAGTDNASAAEAAEIVVITVPYDAQEETVRSLADSVGARVVISTAVPLRFVENAGPIHVDVPQGSATEQVAALMPQARVVGALQTISSATRASLDRDVGADIIVTGDDAEAKTVAVQVLAALPGIRVVDGGPLRNSRYVEQLTVLLLSINMRVRRNTGIRLTNLPDELTLMVTPSVSQRPSRA